MNDTTTDDRLPLNQLIQQVRSELMEAIAKRDEGEKAPSLVVENITLEINFVAEKSGKTEGGAKANLFAVGFKAGAESSYSNQQVHKVTIELTAWENEKREKLSSASASLVSVTPEIKVNEDLVTRSPKAYSPGVQITIPYNMQDERPKRKLRVDNVKAFLTEIVADQSGMIDVDDLNRRLMEATNLCVLPVEKKGTHWILGDFSNPKL